jgi:prepilin-type N-terminal cleavage/methylation domain-containing protein
MNHKNKGLVRQTCGGFTLMELLITLAIISLLVGLLLPALSVVRKAAREAKQRAQITTIELAISAFKNDYGDYPPSSDYDVPPSFNYCGSQKLAEALLGWDLRGFHPKSAWRADGCYPPPPAANFVYLNTDQNLSERKGPYLELATTNAFRLGDSPAGAGLFANTNPLAPERYVICDVFSVKKITLATGKNVSAGTPILYYKANTLSKNIDDLTFRNRIYDFSDNEFLVDRGMLADNDKPPAQRRPHKLYEPAPSPALVYFYEYIRDPKIPATERPWPYRPDTYILISAGADGNYGTEDDIRNFGD